MNLEPGLRVTEAIELRCLIGQGGMGQVWAAFHLALQRDVAVKFLSGPLAENPIALQRFALEAQTIGRLQCPYVPQVFDFGTMQDGSPFIVMELLEGIDLQSRLENDGAFSLVQTGRLVAQMCSVLSLAHGLGLVHRDIKPDNIVLIRGEGETFTAKLLDFGIVKALDQTSDVTRTGATIGTPSYMSPEQLMGEKVIDGRADLWSLAVVAYSCLTGELPFAGETFGAVCLSIHNDTLVDPSARRPGLPAPLDMWFRKALNRDPEERFASAAELSAALSVAVAVDPTHAPLANTSGLPPVESPTVEYLPARPKREHPRKRWVLRTIWPLVAVSALIFGALGSVDPGSVPSWSLAGRMGRAFAGALGERATAFANSRSATAPSAELPASTAVADAQAPEAVVMPRPLRKRPAP
jgi:serine/threonine protein kinase